MTGIVSVRIRAIVTKHSAHSRIAGSDIIALDGSVRMKLAAEGRKDPPEKGYHGFSNFWEIHPLVSSCSTHCPCGW